jgi:pyridoxamine 5'-phosphate oxidase
MTDQELLRRFEAVDLPEFRHLDHVRVAWAVLERDGEAGALDTMMTGLTRFATAKGAPEKFHYTLTRAWLALIADARARVPDAEDAAAILAAYPALGDPQAIERHYSSDRLASDAARRGWVEPNRAALTVAPLEASGGPAPNLDPFAQFAAAVANAQNQGVDTTPMALGTADAQGHPSVRMVLLRGADARGFVFHTNYNSRKARDLTENAHAALCVHWPTLEEQFRIEGAVGNLPADESYAYFASRPRGSQNGAWASDQSAVLPDRAVLETRIRDIEARFEGQAVPRPPFWGGFRIVPLRIEFWYGRVSRLHDRVVYLKDGDEWTIERLFP